MHYSLKHLKAATLVLLLALCATLSSGCGIFRRSCPKPPTLKPCPTCPAPRTVTVEAPCWSETPTLSLQFEDIGADQKKLTDEQVLRLAQSFVVLLNYVQVQQARCGVRPL